MQQLLELYKELRGEEPRVVQTLAKAGSNRQYVRLTSNTGESLIGVIGTDARENRTFIYLSRHFSTCGLPVPQILATTADETRYLQTDLGCRSLYDALSNGRTTSGHYNAHEKKLIEKTLRLLAHFQVCGAKDLDTTQLLPPVYFDEQAVMFDFNYFKYCFLRTTDLAFDELELEKDFQRFAADLNNCKEGDTEQTFLYRDFQARNVMICGAEEKPYFIDFQGGRIGPLQYDVVAFLWQASAQYPEALREEMVEAYMDELGKLRNFDKQSFRERLHLFVLFRTLQVLGAYGLRGYFERKQYFLDSIPHALANLRHKLQNGVCASYPYLEETLQRLCDKLLPPTEDAVATKDTIDKLTEADKPSPLIVRVFSFSYKHGIPEDPTGNGGGYVFDCRAPHNPGRYEPYKKLTGRDAAVIKFLEDDGEILTFLNHVYALADAHVSRYIERGFTSLMFCFGCTGGQHRSVYSAQHTAEYISRKYGVEVRLCHREQGIEEVFPAKRQ